LALRQWTFRSKPVDREFALHAREFVLQHDFRANRMKLNIQMLAALILGLTFLPVQAQQVGGVSPNAPQFSAGFAKLFGEHKAFSAVVRNEITQNGEPGTITMPCRMTFLDGKSRLDIDLTQSKGAQIPAEMTAQLKTMGMAQLTLIALPAKDRVLLIYPGLKAYAEMPASDAKEVKDDSKIKVAATELGKETVEGHPCVKNKVTITDAAGKASQAIVWNASDLKKFPVRIDTADESAKNKMIFTQVKFERPDARLFEAPAGYKRYPSADAMMQEVMDKLMKSIGGAGAK
jgi:hypothetical protein